MFHQRYAHIYVHGYCLLLVSITFFREVRLFNG